MKKLLLLIIILLCISTVTATTFDVNTNTNTGSTCPSNTFIHTFTIHNTGSTKQEYTFSESGSASPFSTIVPVGYILQPQESKLIYIYITPPKDTLPGIYNLELLINNKQQTKTLNFQTQINNCYQTSITAQLPTTACVNDDINLDFSITNNGNYDQTYSLHISSPLQTSISENSIYIPSKQSKSISLFTIPDRKGEFEITLQATSQDTTSSSSTFIIAESCFEYNLLPTKNFVELCDHTTQTIPITIENTGKENVFNLDLQGPSWAKLDSTSLNIPENSQKQTNLIISPDFKTQGDFTFTITSSNKETKKQQEVNVKVNNCHKAELKISKNQDKICRSLSNNYNVILKNTGEFTEQYQLSSNTNWANLDKDFVTLNKQEETSINLNVLPGREISLGDHNIEIKAESSQSNIQIQNSILLQLISEEDCYKPDISAQKTSININPDTTATIPVTIENKGSETATYNLEISGTASAFTQLNPSTITLQPQKSEVVYLYISPSTIKDGSYALTTTARLKDSAILNSEDIDINVGKEFKVPIVEKDKLKIDEKVESIKKYFLPIIIIIVLILLVILGFKSGMFNALFDDKKPKKEEHKKKPVKKDEKPIKKELKPPKKDEKPKEEYITDYWKILKYVISLIILVIAIGALVKYYSLISPYKWFILFGIIILGVILLIIKLGSIKPLIEFFEEEEETKPKEKKEEKPIKKELKPDKKEDKKPKEKSNNLYYILGIVALIIIIILAWRFNVFLSIFNYKWYILGAIIIIAVIILISRYWRGLTSFFEEEEDTKKEVKQKEVKKEDKEKPIKKEETKEEREDYY